MTIIQNHLIEAHIKLQYYHDTLLFSETKHFDDCRRVVINYQTETSDPTGTINLLREHIRLSRSIKLPKLYREKINEERSSDRKWLQRLLETTK